MSSQPLTHHYIGIGKTIFNSSVCHLTGQKDFELFLTERLTREKASGKWPFEALQSATVGASGLVSIAENRDVWPARMQEERLNLAFPFFDHLKKKNLFQYTKRGNEQLVEVTHHRAHALAATLVSPFQESLIVVRDGAGSHSGEFNKDHPEYQFKPSQNGNYFEEMTVYLQKGPQIICLGKTWQSFLESSSAKGHSFTDGIGLLFEKIAEYIFNSKRAAGKVMGLAAYGKASVIESPLSFLESLDWSLQYNGQTKKDWENGPNLKLYQDIAATTQSYFNQEVMEQVDMLHQTFPQQENLILTGGCALNCITNFNVARSGFFKNVYVPPFPGDECIGIGTASHIYYQKNSEWRPTQMAFQNGCFGPQSSVPDEDQIKNIFSGYPLTHSPDIAGLTVDLLLDNKILAWFQGRSESGPRALGARSIICSPLIPHIKEYLNKHIKFREGFRPYGCSCLEETLDQFFEVPKDFVGPFMSFAARVRPEYQQVLAPVVHQDESCRFQSVGASQLPLFHSVLQRFGEQTGVDILLNTSLNIMGEPIVENLHDLKMFLDQSEVYGAVVDNYFVLNPRYQNAQ